MSLQASTSQTVGPFFVIGCTWLNCDQIAAPSVAGERLTIEGRVLDGDGKAVPDALIEIWQANAQGKYAHPDDPEGKSVEPGFRGFGRIPTDDEGKFRFSTIMPGPVPGPDGKTQAPHLAVSVFARGLLRRLVTRIYFPDEKANESDYVLNLAEPGRRGTLIAKKGASAGTLEWNVVLQGQGETVFFDV
ncbi:MAG TPA: protocatechuate 3,4-dioxygenase subunit alpha [Candidatus Acidoferrum sp.]|nr:protocatechuate 3,4-dioxygenase subunit alpha [Candidatus Acidoferrum sp.]